MNRTARQLVFGLIGGVIAYFFTIKALEMASQVPWSDLRLNPALVLLSVVLLMLGYLLLAFNWREVLLSIGQNIKLSDGIYAWTVSQFAKYVPGSIWFAVGRAYIAKQKGVPTFYTTLSTVIESIMMSVAALVIGLLSMTTQAASVRGIFIYAGVALVGLISLHPRILSRLVGFAARRLRITQPVQLRYKELYLLFSNYAVAWVLIGTGFYVLVRSLGLDMPYFASGAFILSWAVGFLAFFGFGGLGIREAALVLLLTPFVGQPNAFVIAVFSRLWWTVGESLAALMSLALRRIASYLKSERVQNVPGNFFNKYGTKNPIERWLVSQYFKRLDELVGKSAASGAKRLLDVGCGEGVVDKKLLEKFSLEIEGLDLEPEVIEKARKNNPGVRYSVGSVLEIPVKDKSFDVVLCGEVMEHLYEPEKAAQELRRVANTVIVTVPREPIWRIGNMARGKYWRALGNTPGHVQNFSPKELRNLLRRYFDRVETKTAGMWTMAICTVERSAQPESRA